MFVLFRWWRDKTAKTRQLVLLQKWILSCQLKEADVSLMSFGVSQTLTLNSLFFLFQYLKKDKLTQWPININITVLVLHYFTLSSPHVWVTLGLVHRKLFSIVMCSLCYNLELPCMPLQLWLTLNWLASATSSPTFPFIWHTVVKVTDKVSVLPGKLWYSIFQGQFPQTATVWWQICFLRPTADFILIIPLSSHLISVACTVCVCLCFCMCLFQLFRS